MAEETTIYKSIDNSFDNSQTSFTEELSNQRSIDNSQTSSDEQSIQKSVEIPQTSTTNEQSIKESSSTQRSQKPARRRQRRKRKFKPYLPRRYQTLKEHFNFNYLSTFAGSTLGSEDLNYLLFSTAETSLEDKLASCEKKLCVISDLVEKIIESSSKPLSNLSSESLSKSSQKAQSTDQENNMNLDNRYINYVDLRFDDKGYDSLISEQSTDEQSAGGIDNNHSTFDASKFNYFDFMQEFNGIEFESTEFMKSVFTY